MKKFYDTSSLLKLQEKAFEEPFVTSGVVINELEHIKTSKNKTEDVRFAARKLARLFDTHSNYQIVLQTACHEETLRKYDLPIINDNLILAAALDFCLNNEEVVFVTEDIILRLTAENILKLEVKKHSVEPEMSYIGYKECCLSEEQMSDFYSNLSSNIFSCLINEYVVIKNDDGDIVDLLKWTGETFITVAKHSLRTIAFGDKIKPKDVYQHMTIDSIMTNTMTIIGGKAGSGKSLLALCSAMRLIETGKYDRLIVMFNPTSTRGASKLGYYSGDMLDKAMQSNIGNVLITKFGERYAVETLISQNKLKLISMADCRGMEIRDNEILFVTECQNASIDLLKLVLSRASQGAKIIIEGDYSSQVDDVIFEGENNGMRRAIEVLKGEDVFGFVELKNVWRSRLAELVERM